MILAGLTRLFPLRSDAERRAVWTFSCACFQSPEGRKQNSPGPSGLGKLRKENRPERAANFWVLFPKDNVRRKRLDDISETKICMFFVRPSGDDRCPIYRAFSIAQRCRTHTDRSDTDTQRVRVALFWSSSSSDDKNILCPKIIRISGFTLGASIL